MLSGVAVFNWSGGKDSALALHYILQQRKFKIHCLLTTVNEAYHRIAMHGVREMLLKAQANSINLLLYQVNLPEMPTMEVYERIIAEHFKVLKQQGISSTIFGDIFLEDLKLYREKQFNLLGIQTVFPLWRKEPKTIIKEFIELGYRAIVVCAQDGLADFCGRLIDQSFIDDLPEHIDPCGENGEFHTFVFDGPIFKKRINFEIGEKVYKSFPSPNQKENATGYWYVDLIPIT